MSNDELHYCDEVVEMTDEQWQRAIEWHRKRMGRSIQKIGASEQTQLYIERLATMPGIERQRLMYGEFLPHECDECHTTQNISKFVDVHGYIKEPIYLCEKCRLLPGNGLDRLRRKWLPGDKE